jgi:carbohydrate-selective porin OprB
VITTGMMNIGIITITATGRANEAIGVTGMTSMNSSKLVRIGTAFGPELRTEVSLFNAQYVTEVWGNATGGESTGTVYTGLMSLQGNVDLQKLLAWQGASVSTRWYWLSGQDISAEHVGNIFTISSIAGFPTFRMNELWFQQNLLNDRVSLRAG